MSWNSVKICPIQFLQRTPLVRILGLGKVRASQIRASEVKYVLPLLKNFPRSDPFFKIRTSKIRASQGPPV